MVNASWIHDGSIFLLTLLLFYFSKLLKDLLTPFKIDREFEQGNMAVGVTMAGYFMGVTAIIIGVTLGPSLGLEADLMAVGGYGLLGLVLLNLCRWVNDRLILYRFRNVEQLIEHRNMAVGVVQFGSYLASGLVIAGAVNGQGGGVETALGFFVLGQAALIVFTWVYNRITPFDIHHQIEQGNVASGLALGGTLVALGIMLMRGTMGNFIGWEENITLFAINGVAACVVLPVLRIFFDKMIIPRFDLNAVIEHQRNISVGMLEASMAISFAVIIFFVLDFSSLLSL